MSTLDIASFKASVNSIPPKTALNAKWILISILKVVEDLAGAATTSDKNQLAESKLSSLVQHVIDAKKNGIETVNAGDITMHRVASLFQLDIDEQRIGRVPLGVVHEHFDVPDILNSLVELYRQTPYDVNCEASSRILVDLVLMACFKTLAAHHGDHFMPSGSKSFPAAFTEQSQITVFPELELRATITDPLTSTCVQVSGRSDWAYGYGARDHYHQGTMLVAIEVKQPITLSSARPQLLAYLALMRYLRLQAGKKNPDVQGCYTDGNFYTFMTIRANGQVEISRQYSFFNMADRKTIFNFMVTMLETTAKCTPSASPSKKSTMVQEVVNYGELMRKSYAPYCDEDSLWMGEIEDAIGTGETPFN